MASAQRSGASHVLEKTESCSSQPTSPASNTEVIDVGEAAYAADEYPSFDEDEQPMTPSAANFEVEESPTVLQHRMFVEEHARPLQMPTASNRLTAPIMVMNILEDPSFSFMPMHQQFTSTQRVKTRSPLQEGPTAPEARYHAQGLSESARPNRYAHIFVHRKPS